jgi:hypothetical protein
MPATRLTTDRRIRIEELAETVYNATFDALDCEIDMDAFDSGRIAAEVQKLVMARLTEIFEVDAE